MERKVVVNIVREANKITVTNNFGKRWEFIAIEDPYFDTSTAAAVASIASSLICGTMTSHLLHTSHTRLSYTLEVNGTM